MNKRCKRCGHQFWPHDNRKMICHECEIKVAENDMHLVLMARHELWQREHAQELEAARRTEIHWL